MFDFAIPTSITLLFTRYGLLGLFVNGMLSSVIPIPTELTISALLASGQSQLNVLVVLTLGSVIGRFLAYYLGHTGKKMSHIIYKKSKTEDDGIDNDNNSNYYYNDKEKKSHILLEKYGTLIIFLSPWIPIAGDIIPIIAGVKKYNFKKFAVAMVVGKTVKAVAIVYFLAIILSLVFH